MVLTYIQLQSTVCGSPLPPNFPQCPAILPHPTHGEPYNNYVANNSTQKCHTESHVTLHGCISVHGYELTITSS